MDRCQSRPVHKPPVKRIRNRKKSFCLDGAIPKKRIELEDAFGIPYHVCSRSCVCTNAKVEYDLRNHYSAGDPTVQAWNRFDMIIIDEAHSLLSDATYQSSAFYVRRLIQKTLKNSKTCKVIVMTGSPKILEKHPVIDEIKSSAWFKTY